MNEKNIYLEGESIFLRSVTANDFGEKMVAWVNDKEVTKYLSRGTFPGHLAAFQEEYESLKNSKTDVQLSVCMKKDNRYIGVTGLHSLNWVARHGEFRILIGEKDCWGKGAGTEAAQLMTAYGFHILNLNKVWLGVNAENEKAYKSYLKAGFKDEGRLRNEVFRNNQYFDVIRMSILREEYEKMKSTWPLYDKIQKQLSV